MPISVSNQAYVFLFSVISGMLIAFIYDIFRIKRKSLKTRNLFIFIEDFVYWIIVALVMFGVVYYSNDGEIRGYIFIGTLIGAILYALLLSSIVIKSLLFFIDIIKRIIKMVWKIISYPFRIIYRLLKLPCRMVARQSGKMMRSARSAGRNRLVKVSLWGRRIKNKIKKI